MGSGKGRGAGGASGSLRVATATIATIAPATTRIPSGTAQAGRFGTMAGGGSEATGRAIAAISARDATAQALAAKIETLMRNPQRLADCAAAMRTLAAPNAAEKLADLVVGDK